MFVSVSVVQVEVSATDSSLVQRCPTEYGYGVCHSVCIRNINPLHLQWLGRKRLDWERQIMSLTFPVLCYSHTSCIKTAHLTRWRNWSTHCPTSRKDAGSIPDGDIAVFNWLHPSSRIVALESTLPLTEMSTRGKGGRCLGLTILPLWRADYLKDSARLNLVEPKGPVHVCKGIALPFYITSHNF